MFFSETRCICAQILRRSTAIQIQIQWPPKLTEERGERVMATRVRFVVGRSERQSSADLQCPAAGRYRRWRRGGDGGPGVAVSLARVGAARHGGPRQRVELGRVEAEDVAGTDGDQLVRHERQLLEAEFGRPEERLADQRVVVQCGRCGMLMMMMMLSRTLSDATVKSVHGSPNLPRRTNDATILQFQIMLFLMKQPYNKDSRFML